jgi:hypothetical protein
MGMCKMRLTTDQLEVPHDPELIDVLAKILGSIPRPMAIVETGTYQGLGTTQIVIKALTQMVKNKPQLLKMPTFTTIEASEKNCLIAKNNLREHGWIQILHGCSVDLKEAEEFIKNDKAILNHEEYPDILIDSLDPVNFYLQEIQGTLFGPGKRGKDNLLLKLMPDIWNKRPLFILDSAGGMGFFEFQTVVKLMGDSRYHIFMDDINHLKHFRSKAYIQKCRWPILFEDKRCLLALHPGKSGKPKSIL